MLRIFRNSAAALILLSLALSAAANTTTQIASIKSASTDGSPSDSTFSLVVAADTAANALTTTTTLELSVAVTPSEAHRGTLADLYTVIVASDKFFKLAPDGGYVPWDGTVEDLTPFATERMLGADNKFTLIDGTLAEAGSYLYFNAYSAQGESRLHFTPEPAQLNIKASTTLPDDTHSAAARTFDTEIETDIVQARCITCHVEGGLARSSALQFQRTNTASSLNNFGALSEYIELKGAELLLAKVAGGEGHVGGLQLAPDSDGYVAIEKIIAELANVSAATSYVFSSSGDGASAREASFLSSVVLEPREATLRRAALLLQGRVPTDAEKKLAGTEAGLRTALRALMKGPAFREFAVTATNDRLLTQGAQFPLSLTSPNFIKIYRARVKVKTDEDQTNDHDLYNLIQPLVRRASGELVAYIIEKDKSYNEVLTADYMMMNKELDYWLDGSAVFGDDDSDALFKPSRINGYYKRNSFRKTVKRVNSNSEYEIISPPLADYPHAGLLTDFGFLSRYPTTATNRNRARARWILYHFLGIDVEKSSQRPSDEAALADRNNPTMNNPNCTVCHSLLDPVAGAFQNWSENNFYLEFGEDVLDQFYKYPEDGSISPYRRGDRWYRDMREPGLFGEKIEDRDTTLRSLANLIIEEPSFRSSAARFWWAPIFGKPVLDKPAVESDQGYPAKYAAYQAQQNAIEEFAEALSQRMNAKDMFVEMLMSPWFGSEQATSFTFDSAQFEAEFGNKQLLSPEQLARKTRALTGVLWRSKYDVKGRLNSAYDTYGVLIGGIDSNAVTSRATELTPTMASILMTHATETACPAVVRQFIMPAAERSLFSLVEESALPLAIADKTFTLESAAKAEWRTASIDVQLNPGPKSVSLKFLNQYCDYDGVRCLEHRTLFMDSMTLTSPSGRVTEVRASDERLEVLGDYCNVDWEGYLRFGSNCTITFDTNLAEAGIYKFGAKVSAELPVSIGGNAEIRLAVSENVSVLEATTPNALAIRNQISRLFAMLHGSEYLPESDEVAQVFEIFSAALSKADDAHNGNFWQCNLTRDGLFYDDNLTQSELDTFRYVAPGNDWYQDDWNARSVFDDAFRADPFGTKYAWTAVMMYMLSHYDYLHE